MLEVITNLMPAKFSTARLLVNPIRATSPPIKKHNNHFMNMYWKIWILPLVLQSCLKKSFSAILKVKSHFLQSRNLHQKGKFTSRRAKLATKSTLLGKDKVFFYIRTSKIGKNTTSISNPVSKDQNLGDGQDFQRSNSISKPVAKDQNFREGQRIYIKTSKISVSTTNISNTVANQTLGLSKQFT